MLWHRRSAANGATALVRGEHTSEAVTAHRVLPVATRKDASEGTRDAHQPWQAVVIIHKADGALVIGVVAVIVAPRSSKGQRTRALKPHVTRHSLDNHPH